jgi:hypothetical protein
MNLDELAGRLRQRYARVEVRQTGSGKVLLVEDFPPLPVPDFLSDLFLGYLCEQYPALHPADLGLNWSDD